MTDDRLPVPAVSAELEQIALPPNPVEVYLQTLGSTDSQRTMQRSLNRLAEFLTGQPTPATTIPWHELRPDRTTYLRAILLTNYAPTTARKMLSALSGVLHQCWRLGLMPDEDYRRAIDWGTVKGEGLTGAQAGRHVENGEMRALFASCATERHLTTGARDAAMIGMLYGAGLRRGEVVALDLDDYDPESGDVVVHGKGNKKRTTRVPSGSREAIDAWLQVRGRQAGPLFVAVNKAGRVDPRLRRLTTQAVYAMLQRRAPRAKVKRFAPHDMRRTFIGDLLDAGVDIATVQKMAGHVSAATTAGYDRRGERAKARASERLHVPYVQPDTLDGDK